MARTARVAEFCAFPGGCRRIVGFYTKTGRCPKHAAAFASAMRLACRACPHVFEEGEERYRVAMTKSGGHNASGRLRAWLCKPCYLATEAAWDAAKQNRLARIQVGAN